MANDAWANVRILERAYQAERKLREALQERSDQLQAYVDALMLEYCPDEMTAEQMQRYASCQQVCDEPKKA